jgi:hypothetical protein
MKKGRNITKAERDEEKIKKERGGRKRVQTAGKEENG